MHTSKLNSRLPVVCVIAIEGTKDFKELTKEFISHITKSEPEVYAQNLENKTNLSDKIHRLQFGRINLSRNPKFRNDIINKFNKPNPKYFVYVSDAERVGVFNNIQDLEYVVDDAIHGEFSDLTPIKEVMEHDYEIHELLTNETLSFLRVVIYHLTSSLFYRVLMFGLAFIVFTRLANLEAARALIVSGCLIAAMILYGIVEKLIVENLI